MAIVRLRATNWLEEKVQFFLQNSSNMEMHRDAVRVLQAGMIMLRSVDYDLQNFNYLHELLSHDSILCNFVGGFSA